MTVLVNWRSCKYILKHGKTSLVKTKKETLGILLFFLHMLCVYREENVQERWSSVIIGQYLRPVCGSH